MALTKITPEIVAVNAIQGTLIADNAITAVHIATNAVSGTLIADNAVTATHIAQNVITVTQLADDAVEADKIADGVITTNHLNKAMISSQTEVTAASGDYVLIGDTSDSNNLKKALASDFGNSLANNTNNYVVTATGSGLNGEANLTFDGTTLAVTGGMTTTSNIGLGTATDSWHSSYDAIQGANFSLSTEAAAGAGKAVTLAYNAYIDSGNEWTFINSDEASHIQQYNGQLTYSSAAAGTSDNTITFAERMRISATGKASWSAGGVGTVATQSRDFTFYSEGASNGIDLRSNDYQIVFLGAGASSGSGMDAGYAQLCVDGTAKIALNANGNSYFNGGNVGMGTSSPGGVLDIPSGSYSATKPAMMLGGDIDTAGAGSRTDNTRKYSSIVGYHYSNEEEPVGILGYDCQSDSVAIVNVGIPSASYNSPSEIRFFTGATSITASPTQRMCIDASGRVGIGTTSPADSNGYAETFTLAGSGNTGMTIRSGTSNYGSIRFADGTSDPSDSMGIIHYYHTDNAMMFFANNTEYMKIFSDGKVRFGLSNAGTPNAAVHVMGGNFQVSGSITKGSGSFRIDHPLESKKDTHDFVHSFTEAPQADLIYRGTATLSSGTATVNIDTAAGMTNGTFVLLCGDVQCFTTNESNWDAVKGSVSGNTLTITCENASSTATVSWLVIGERKDKHMIDTEWTDSQGKVIVEPLKTEGFE